MIGTKCRELSEHEHSRVQNLPRPTIPRPGTRPTLIFPSSRRFFPHQSATFHLASERYIATAKRYTIEFNTKCAYQIPTR
jgi:hypothetical protein